MSDHNLTGVDLERLTDIDRLIHEPSRLVILALLSIVKSADFLFVLNQTGLTRGNLSAHMSKLEEAGYVEVTKEFVEKTPRTLLRLTDEGRTAFEAYRHHMIDTLGKLGE